MIQKAQHFKQWLLTMTWKFGFFSTSEWQMSTFVRFSIILKASHLIQTGCSWGRISRAGVQPWTAYNSPLWGPYIVLCVGGIRIHQSIRIVIYNWLYLRRGSQPQWGSLNLNGVQSSSVIWLCVPLSNFVIIKQLSELSVLIKTQWYGPPLGIRL